MANKLYIFGGTTAAGKLASVDVHVITLKQTEKPEPDYAVIPAITDAKNGEVPAARSKHAACKLNVCVAVFGGVDEAGGLIDDGLWLFVTAKSAWEKAKPSTSPEGAKPCARSGAKLFETNNNLVLYGGDDANGTPLSDVWYFDYVSSSWTELPSAPTSSTAAALVDSTLYIISHTGTISSDVHHLPIHPSDPTPPKWETTSYPTNPLTPGPLPRTGAGLLPITTGHGRHYLLYLFGVRSEALSLTSASTDDAQPPAEYWSDLWTYQIPSSSPEAKLTTSLSDAIKPAKIKDKIRSALGFETGERSWYEVEVLPPRDLEGAGGKVHPGPRGWMGCDVAEDGSSAVVWGGVNAKGEREGDGWVIKLE